MIGVIVQARMASTRLPGKVMLDLNGKPVLQHVLERAAQIRGVDKVILATNHDLELTNLACALGYDYFALHAPNEDDVLTRYYKCADWYGLDTIVRITADCPALNSDLSSRVLERFIAGKYDYYSNCRPESLYPDGWDTEVFSMAVLEDAFRHAMDRYDREHVTPYMYRNKLKYRVGRLIQPKNESNIRLTLDTQEDLDRLCRYMLA